MRICQRNSHVLPVNEQYAIERDYLDVGFTSMYRGLAYFLQANDDRRSLLLGKRRPRIREKKYLNLLQSGETDIDRIVAKALSAQDYFLLVGPPGTGISCPQKNSLKLFTRVRIQYFAHSLYSQSRRRNM